MEILKPMSDVKQVIAQVAPQDRATGDPGRVTYGYYTMTGREMTMTDASGVPIRNQSGDKITATVPAGMAPERLAKQLTLRIRRAVYGEAEPGPSHRTGFNRPLSYRRFGLA